jgi:hypothetical protein
MKTFTEFLNESDDSNELKRYGIKELRDGLTLDKLREKFS